MRIKVKMVLAEKDGKWRDFYFEEKDLEDKMMDLVLAGFNPQVSLIPDWWFRGIDRDGSVWNNL